MKKILYVCLFVFIFFGISNKVEASQIISNGTYKIQSAVDSNKVLDIAGGKSVDEANVQLYQDNNSDNQKWNIKYLGNDYYEITSFIDANKSLDVFKSSKVNGTNVQLYQKHGGDGQKWIIKYAGNGYYNIISKCNNLYLDVYRASNVNGTNIQMYSGHNGVSQKFKLIEIIEPKPSISSGLYTITSALNNGKTLDVYKGDAVNEANIQLYDLYDGWGQIWNVTDLGDGYYSLTSYLNNNMALDVFKARSINGTNVQLYQKHNGDSQKWIIKSDGNGYYNIVSKLDNMYLDVTGAKTKNETNIEIYHGNSGDAQKFKFNKIEVNVLDDGLYTINSMVGENKRVAANGEVAANLVNVNLKTANNLNSQKWYVKHLGKGFYSITSALSNNVSLDVNGGSSSNGTNVQLYQKHGGNSQKWFIKYAGNGNYNIVTSSGYKYLDVNRAGTTDGTNIQIYQGNNGNSQKFTFTKTELNNGQKTFDNGYYVISSLLDSTKVIDANGGKKKNGTNIEIYQYGGSNNQIWYLKYLNNGYYSITSAMNPNISLDVENSAMSDGTNVSLYKYNGTNNQQWFLKDLGNGNVSIIAKHNGLYLTVNNKKAINGQNISVNRNDDSISQVFKLTKYTGQKVYKGVDISYWNSLDGKSINWQKVGESNIGFVIIRAGYGGNWTNQDDKKFLDYVRACEKYNIPYGVYLYSNASNAGSGQYGPNGEADHVLRLLRDNGITPTIKTNVFLDMEDSAQAPLGKETLTKIADEFCTIMTSNGFSCGIYSNINWFKNNLDSQYLASKYPIWLSWYFSQVHPTFNDALNKVNEIPYNLTPFKYWQFASDGDLTSIGFYGNIDVNIGYDIFD